MSQESSNRFLSIQSHVVSGYCGNKSSTFPLQLLGNEVDVINSVQLSNHTQYKLTKGQIFGSNDLEQLHTGLKENNLLKLYDNILTGYVSDVGYIESMSKLIKDIKQDRPDSIYCFDPVLGDIECGFYVTNGEKIRQAYLDKLIPLADIVTPNAFEAAKLTKLEFDPSSSDSMSQIKNIIRELHKLGPTTIAVTSFELHAGAYGGDNQLNCILSHVSKLNGRNEAWLVRVPKIPKAFYGTGDLFAALLSAWSKETDSNWKLSLENSVNTIQAILNDTSKYADRFNDGTPLPRELRLVQNQEAILKPPKDISAEKIVIF